MLWRLGKKLGLFSLGFVVALLFFFLFEPYNYWNLKSDSWYSARYMAGMREMLLRDPTHILLGDSRMANMNVEYIEEISGERYCNLAYGGATLNESIEQFWFTVENTTRLEKVVISVDFYTVNGKQYDDTRLASTIEKAKNPIKFVTEFEYWVSAFDNFGKSCRNLWADVTDNDAIRWVDDDPSSLEYEDPVFTTEQVGGYRADLYYYAHTVLGNMRYYGYGEVFTYTDQLLEIADYCNQNGIELVFWIPNVHVSMWDIVVYDVGADAYIDFYKDQLKAVATVYDGEFYNDYAKQDDYFIDGLHFTKDEKLHMARILFAGEPSEYYLVTSPAQYLAGDYELTDQMSIYPPGAQTEPPQETAEPDLQAGAA